LASIAAREIRSPSSSARHKRRAVDCSLRAAIFIRGIAVQHGGAFQLLGTLSAALAVAFDELYLIFVLSSLANRKPILCRDALTTGAKGLRGASPSRTTRYPCCGGKTYFIAVFDHCYRLRLGLLLPADKWRRLGRPPCGMC